MVVCRRADDDDMLKRRQTIDNSLIGARCGWTPYDGVAVTGWPVATIIRGVTVMREGEIVAAGTGEPVRFHVALGTA